MEAAEQHPKTQTLQCNTKVDTSQLWMKNHKRQEVVHNTVTSKSRFSECELSTYKDIEAYNSTLEVCAGLAGAHRVPVTVPSTA